METIMNKKILFLLAGAITLMLFCAKRDEQINRINPFDTNGDNYFPPTVTAMADTTVFIKDPVNLHASCIDSNGYVKKILWAKDGKNFSDSTDSINPFLVHFSTPGKDTILVRAIDNDGVKSKDTDTVIVTVRLGMPTISVTPNGAVVGIGDSVKLIASCFDTNGYIKAIYWAMDGTNYSATPGTDTVIAVYSSQGTKTILAKVMDDDSLVTFDTVRVFVRDKAPLIFSPVPNAVLTNNIITLQWHPGIYNNHYRVLADTINPPSAIVNASTADTFSVVSNLVFNKSYWWKVIGFSNSGDTASSETWKFNTPVKPPIPTDGLVAYYPFNGNANDESGNGNNGTVYGATLTTDRFGKASSAYAFNGISSYINAGETLFPIAPTAFSVSIWFNTGNKSESILFDQTQGAQFSIGIRNDSILASYGSNGVWIPVCTKPFSPQGWVHLAISYSNVNGIQSYINGSFIQTIAVSQPITGVNDSRYKFMIGRWGSTLSQDQNNLKYFDGSIDDIRIYNRVLSAQEIQALYHEGGYIPPLVKPSLFAWGSDSVTIKTQWNSQSGATGYILQSASDSMGPFSQIYSGSDTAYSNTGLTNNQKVWYRVKATNATQTSDWSDTVGAAAINIPTNGLVAYYPFNGNANDMSGNGHNGIVTNASLSVDRFGNQNSAYSFNDGSNSYIDFGTWFNFNIFTISMWVKRNAMQSSNDGYVDLIDNYHGNNRSWCVEGYSTSASPYGFGIGCNPSGTSTTFTLSNNVWQHLILLKRADSIMVYLDGYLISSSGTCSTIIYDGTQNLRIADYSTSRYPRFWNGILDDIHIYNRALSATEIQQIYHEGGWTGQ